MGAPVRTDAPIRVDNERPRCRVDDEILHPFENAAHHLFESMLGLELSVGVPVLRLAREGSQVIGASIGLRGEVEGVVTLSMGADVARRLAAVLTYEDRAFDEDELEDAVRETLDMLVGVACKEFSGMVVRASPATTPAPEMRGLLSPAASRRALLPCSCDCGEFTLELSLRVTKASETTLTIRPARQGATS